MKNYLIKYTVFDNLGFALRHGTMRVKKKLNEFEAKVKFEAFCKKKYPEFGKLVIHECKEETRFDSIVSDLFSQINKKK